GAAATLGSDGKFYVSGGINGNGVVIQSVESYDPVANTWTNAGYLATARAFHQSFTGLDGSIYAVGGTNNAVNYTSFAAFPTLSFSNYVNSVDVLGPFTAYWASSPAVTVARFGHATVAGSDGRIWSLGGQDNSGNYLAQVEAWYPAV